MNWYLFILALFGLVTYAGKRMFDTGGTFGDVFVGVGICLVGLAGLFVTGIWWSIAELLL